MVYRCWCRWCGRGVEFVHAGSKWNLVMKLLSNIIDIITKHNTYWIQILTISLKINAKFFLLMIPWGGEVQKYNLTIKSIAIMTFKLSGTFRLRNFHFSFLVRIFQSLYSNSSNKIPLHLSISIKFTPVSDLITAWWALIGYHNVPHFFTMYRAIIFIGKNMFDMGLFT